ncbi:cyanophycinase [Hymenobacter actinosclerus]|uniref:Cyanophycinase n=1 Tax=Hymenobacter actinosclerus TaxID=82805 RepID=A0A1H9Z2R6_9BACT|nr:cyanophycinase [Hymenobacter actinosclerus]SES75801.1 cyanophycinase [Hymenobacter actinosclerus]
MPQTPAAFPLGTLVALGGGDDDAMLALLGELLPTPETPVEIVTAASWRNAAMTGAAYERSFRELGCPAARYLPISEHQSADAPATLRRLARAGLVFFSGGDQERLLELLAGTEFARQLQQRFQHDAAFIVAGTSAGAAALPEQMIIDGYGWRSLRKGGIKTGAGLNLLPRLFIDQHFAERGRFGRLAHALLAHPACLGLGLSEETGLIIRGGRHATVFGDGVATVLDARALHGTNLGRIGRGEPVSCQDLRLHLLVAGQQLDLTTCEIRNSA